MPVNRWRADAIPLPSLSLGRNSEQVFIAVRACVGSSRISVTPIPCLSRLLVLVTAFTEHPPNQRLVFLAGISMQPVFIPFKTLRIVAEIHAFIASAEIASSEYKGCPEVLVQFIVVGYMKLFKRTAVQWV